MGTCGVHSHDLCSRIQYLIPCRLSGGRLQNDTTSLSSCNNIELNFFSFSLDFRCTIGFKGLINYDTSDLSY